MTGEENLRHMHRMRALSDAVIVGAGTVAADDPQLTTRQVSGPSPLRVVIDPMRRLAPTYRVFQDEAAPTLYVCGRGRLARGERYVGAADILGVHEGPGGLDLAELEAHLRGRGCARLFVEGGGVTVSAFLAAGLLDRLHVAVAPFLIGAGRPAIRLPAPDLLRECARPRHRVFRMGTDVLFDCDLRTEHDGPRRAASPRRRPIVRDPRDPPARGRSQRLQELDQRCLLPRRQVERERPVVVIDDRSRDWRSARRDRSRPSVRANRPPRGVVR